MHGTLLRPFWRAYFGRSFTRNVENDPKRSLGVFDGSGMIVEDIADNPSLRLGFNRIDVSKLLQCDHGLPDCPASRTLPGGGIKPDSRSECLSGGLIEKCPCNYEVTGRIADATVSEVDDCIQQAAFYQEIGCSHVAVNPYRRHLP